MYALIFTETERRVGLIVLPESIATRGADGKYTLRGECGGEAEGYEFHAELKVTFWEGPNIEKWRNSA